MEGLAVTVRRADTDTVITPRGSYVKAEGAPDPAHVVREAAPHSVSIYYMSVPETREDLSASDLHRQKRQNAKNVHERKKVVRAVGRGS